MTGPADDTIARRFAWIAALLEPRRTLSWTLAEWEAVVRIARRLRLLARLAESLDAAALLGEVPEAPRRHLVAEQRVSRYRTAAMRWALERIMAALGEPGFPCVLLKGAAYLGQGLPIAAGRLPSDLDILVPRVRFDAVQRLLAADGWKEAELDAHDRRFYREWSHEAPPMRHALHPIELDLHHDILPPVAKTRVDIARLLESVQPSALPGWSVLQPVDQVLHSAAHLFLDSEARDRLRDLVDLDGLLRHFGSDPAFHRALLARAGEIGLAEPLALGAHFCRRWLGTPIPSDVRAGLAAHEPSGLRRAWLMPTLVAVLTPADPDRRAPWAQGLAATVFLVRYHAGRMPLRILVPHLAHKLRAHAADVTAPRDAGAGDAA